MNTMLKIYIQEVLMESVASDDIRIITGIRCGMYLCELSVIF